MTAQSARTPVLTLIWGLAAFGASPTLKVLGDPEGAKISDTPLTIHVCMSLEAQESRQKWGIFSDSRIRNCLVAALTNIFLLQQVRNTTSERLFHIPNN